MSLDLLGGGGSLLTVPLLVYVAGLDAHDAVAGSLFVVAVTSGVALVGHTRAGGCTGVRACCSAPRAWPAPTSVDGPRPILARQDHVERSSRLTPAQLAALTTDAEATDADAPVVVDVRGLGERERGHIPGSLHIPLAELRVALQRRRRRAAPSRTRGRLRPARRVRRLAGYAGRAAR